MSAPFELRLDRLIGQDHALARLRAALEAPSPGDERPHNLHHAILFEGPSGVGKRTAALALAARLLCRTPDGASACGGCASCTKLVETEVGGRPGRGRNDPETRREVPGHPDLYFTKKSDSGNILLGKRENAATWVGSVRWLEERLHLRAHQGGAKVAVVEDADALQLPAANGFLKTLEEPPPNTFLLLTTDHPDRLLPTVLSRCLRIRFRSLDAPEVKAVLAQADPGLSESDRELLAAASDGAPGRALERDRAALAAELDRVRDLDRRLDRDRPRAPLEAVDLARELVADKEALPRLLETWARWSRDQLLIGLVRAGDRRDRLSYPGHEADLAELAARRPLERLLERTDALLEARRQLALPTNLNRQMLVEQALLTLAGVLPLRRVPPLLANLANR